MTVQNYAALLNALSNSDNYPRNLPSSNTFEHTLKAVEGQLTQRSSKLFVAESQPSSQVDLLIFELYREQEGHSMKYHFSKATK